MEQQYLIDTNPAIDYLDNKLPDKAANLIDDIEIKMSVITRIELLAWPDAAAGQLIALQSFINASTVFNLEETITVKCIDIRRHYRIKLPDAIIAATALVYNLTPITRNIDDFKNIPGLNLRNPWQ